MSIQATVYSNNKARQELNTQYMHQSGAFTMSEVINGFARGSVIFISLSILVSTFSVYQDFYKALTIAMGVVLGGLVAFMIGFSLAVAIEYFRHLAIKGVFNTSLDNMSRLLIGVIAMLLLAAALTTHFRSLDVFGKIITGDALQAKNQEIAYQRGLTNDNVKALVSANVEAAKGINNGTTTDDDNVEAITTSNNALIRTMMILNGESNRYQTELTIRESEDMAETVTGTLFVLFIIIELLAMFSIVSKLLLNRNTDHNVKELATLMDKTMEMQDNMYQALGNKIIADANVNVNHAFKEYGQITGRSAKPTETIMIEDRFRNTDRVEECEEPVEDDCLDAEPIYTTINNEKVRALDYKLYNEDERKLLLIMFDNGDILPNESLIKRTAIIAEAKGELGIKNAGEILTALNGKLLDKQYIESTPRGYKAKSALPKDLWQSIES